jgi:hypothetical protein
MKEVRGGPPNTARTQGSIEGPTAIASVNTKPSADLQGPRHPVPRAPTRSLAERRSAELRRLQRQRYAQRIWPLGDRVLFELVDHIADRFGLEDEVDRLLDRFAGLSPEILKAVGADRLPEPPIHLLRQIPRRPGPTELRAGSKMWGSNPDIVGDGDVR